MCAIVLRKPVSHSQAILKYLGMRVLRSSWLYFQE